MSRPRVGLLVNSYQAEFGLYAGGFIHTVEVAKRWEEFEIVVFAPRVAEPAFREMLPNAKFVPMPELDRYCKGRALTFLARTLLAPIALRRLQTCDVLVIASSFLPDVFPACLFGARRATLTLWHVQDLPWRRPGSLAVNILAYLNEWVGLALVKMFFTTIIAGSRYIAARLGLTDRAVFVTTNGVEHLKVADIPRGEGRVGAAFVGRLHWTKGVEDLLRAWSVVVGCVGSQPLFIVGDGDPGYRAKLESLARELGLDSVVHFLGRLSEQEKVETLERARIFVFPSHEEGWGIVIAEAMALGLPCVTYDLPVFAEVFPVGRLEVRMGDVQAFADAAIRMLSDRELYERCAAEGLRLSEGFTWEHAARIEAAAVHALLAR